MAPFTLWLKSVSKGSGGGSQAALASLQKKQTMTTNTPIENVSSISHHDMKKK